MHSHPHSPYSILKELHDCLDALELSVENSDFKTSLGASDQFRELIEKIPDSIFIDSRSELIEVYDRHNLLMTRISNEKKESFSVLSKLNKAKKSVGKYKKVSNNE